MELFLAQANSVVGIIAVVGLGVAGAFGVASLFDKGRKERLETSDKLDDRVITLLKEQVEQLEKKVEAQARDLKTNSLRLEALISENKTLREVLQGRDAATMEYQRMGRKAMALVEETHTAVLNQGSALERLLTVIESQSKTTKTEVVTTTS